jgi:hypothetical protein
MDILSLVADPRIGREIITGNYILVIWLIILWCYNGIKKSKEPEFLDSFNHYDYRKNSTRLVSFFSVLPMILWAAFRDNIQDTYNYRASYLEMEVSWSKIIDIIKSDTVDDKGLSVLSTIIKIFVGNNDILFFGIIAAIMLLTTSEVYRRTSPEYSMSIFLLVASGDYYSWCLNGMRQGLAVAMVFYASLKLIDKKYFQFILLLLFAVSIHSTAIVFIVALLLYNQRPWSPRVLIIGFVFLLGVFLFTNYTSIAQTIFADTHYEHAVAEIKKDSGVNILRVLVYSVPTIIAFVYREKLDETADVAIVAGINISFIGTILYVVAMFTSGILIGRLPIYFTLWNYVLLAWEIKNLFYNKQRRTVVKFIMVLAYLVFNYYQTMTNASIYLR